MKRIKTWSVFESTKTSYNFASPSEIEDILLELLDDNIINKCEFLDSGWMFFPVEWNREIKSKLYLNMINLNKSSFREFFINPEEIPNRKGILNRRVEFIFLDDVMNSMSSNNPNSFENLFIKNSESGDIPAYPIMLFSLGYFGKENLQKLIDVLKRIYYATDFRPVKGFWEEDYVDEETGDLVTHCGAEIQFVKVSDTAYKNMIENYAEYFLEKTILPNFL